MKSSQRNQTRRLGYQQAQCLAGVIQGKPIAIIGGSILVYRGRFEVPLVAALSHYGRTRQLIDMIRFDEAVADGAKAVELAPDDPNARYVLRLAFIRSGQ